MTHRLEEHSFSIEMDRRDSLSNVSLSDKPIEGVLVQGELGELVELTLLEDVTLEVRGVKGTLRLDISREEIASLLNGKMKIPQS
jgi:hypothetical protein